MSIFRFFPLFSSAGRAEPFRASRILAGPINLPFNISVFRPLVCVSRRKTKQANASDTSDLFLSRCLGLRQSMSPCLVSNGVSLSRSNCRGLLTASGFDSPPRIVGELSVRAFSPRGTPCRYITLPQHAARFFHYGQRRRPSLVILSGSVEEKLSTGEAPIRTGGGIRYSERRAMRS